MLHACQRIGTSMSAEQASSGAIRRTSLVSTHAYRSETRRIFIAAGKRRDLQVESFNLPTQSRQLDLSKFDEVLSAFPGRMV
jgi:hypothetical protein